MRLISLLFVCLMMASAGQEPAGPVQPPPEDMNRLPNGKSRKDAIAKDDFQKSLKDAEDLVKLSQALQEELKKNDRYVISVSEIHKTQEIEKLARRIRGRLKSN